jgi:hypothetical protein
MLFPGEREPEGPPASAAILDHDVKAGWNLAGIAHNPIPSRRERLMNRTQIDSRHE